MATQVKHPIWLPALGSPGAGTFASLYAIESFARALLSSVVPIQAYDLLRSEQKVSLLYTCVSVFALLITLTTPLLLRTFARRWVYSMGAVLLIAAAAALATHTLTGQVIGQLCRSAGAGALALGLNLYIMDHIHKTKFMQSESLRMAWSTLGWTIGPAAGVALYTRLGLAAPYAASAVCSIALLALFWFYRLSENTAIRAGGKAKQEVNPLKSVGRFLSQPRLRLAWLIAFGRSCFWSTFFVYGPILMVVSGQGSFAGGLLVSAGNAMLFCALFWGRIGRRFGARRVMSLAFAGMTAGLLAAGACGEGLPLLAAVFLLACTVFTIALDAIGSTAFFRAVRPRERAEMTGVYRTYLDLSELMPPLVYSIVLAFFGIGAVFATLGLFCAVCGVICWRYLPKSM